MAENDTTENTRKLIHSALHLSDDGSEFNVTIYFNNDRGQANEEADTRKDK